MLSAIKSQAGNNPKVGSVCLVHSSPRVGISFSPTKVMFSRQMIPDTWQFRGSDSLLICCMPELTFYSYTSVSKADCRLVFIAHLSSTRSKPTAAPQPRIGGCVTTGIPVAQTCLTGLIHWHILISLRKIPTSSPCLVSSISRHHVQSSISQVTTEGQGSTAG